MGEGVPDLLLYVFGAVVLGLAALLGISGIGGRRKGGDGSREVPEDPPRPDTAPLDRDIAVADHEAEERAVRIQDALDDDGDGPGLAGEFNRRG